MHGYVWVCVVKTVSFEDRYMQTNNLFSKETCRMDTGHAQTPLLKDLSSAQIP